MDKHKMYLASWSGGKDSCLACYKAMKDKNNIFALLHFEREHSLHGVGAGFIRAQSELAGISMIQKQVRGDFESAFKDAVRDINGVKGIVFGDIYLEEHRRWLERVCRELHVEAMFPLWQRSTEEILTEFIHLGFEAIVVSGRKELIESEWIGHKLDEEFIGYLRAKGLDVCGENGEYHTFVTAGPLFKGRIDIQGRGIKERDGHWFLDIEGIRIMR